jgi:hypothetical protein
MYNFLIFLFFSKWSIYYNYIFDVSSAHFSLSGRRVKQFCLCVCVCVCLNSFLWLLCLFSLLSFICTLLVVSLSLSTTVSLFGFFIKKNIIKVMLTNRQTYDLNKKQKREDKHLFFLKMFYDWNSLWRGTVTSICTYSTIHYVLSKLISHKDKQKHWKRINIATSFIHSILSSVISLYVLVRNLI